MRLSTYTIILRRGSCAGLGLAARVLQCCVSCWVVAALELLVGAVASTAEVSRHPPHARRIDGYPYP